MIYIVQLVWEFGVKFLERYDKDGTKKNQQRYISQYRLLDELPHKQLIKGWIPILVNDFMRTKRNSTDMNDARDKSL